MSATTNKLAVTKPSDFEIVLTREFNAPRSLVFEAFTKPEHVSQWWPACDMTMAVCEIDLRVGGAFRYVARTPGGDEHPFIGVYREIAPPERLVNTLIYDIEPYRNSEALVTLVLEDLGGNRTRMVETVRHGSQELRDAHLNSGMEYGAAQSLDQLEALVAKFQGRTA